MAPLVHFPGYYMLEKRGIGRGVLIVHGTTKWHPVALNYDAARIPGYTVIVGAAEASELVSARDLIYSESDVMVVKDEVAKTLAEAGVTRPWWELLPSSRSGD